MMLIMRVIAVLSVHVQCMIASRVDLEYGSLKNVLKARHIKWLGITALKWLRKA